MKTTHLSIPTAQRSGEALTRAFALVLTCAMAACSGSGNDNQVAASPQPVPNAGAQPIELPAPVPAPAPAPATATSPFQPSQTRIALQASVPEPDYSHALAIEIFRAVNSVRANAGIGLLRQEGRMDLAAGAHVAYMLRNNSGGHVETYGQPMFTGVSHIERLAAAGYTGGYVWENVSGGANSGSDIVLQTYMSTPYHRVPFLVADSTSIGIGVERPYPSLSLNTLLFGFAMSAPQQLGASKLVVWPFAGMADSPIQGCCEIPNPFAGVRSLWGYPVSLHGPFQSRIAVASFRLNGPDGAAVEAHLLTAQNDPNRMLPESAVMLIPLAPLAKSANYSATAVGTLDGIAFTKTWSFTTRS